jgi:hypothetical protein
MINGHGRPIIIMEKYNYYGWLRTNLLRLFVIMVKIAKFFAQKLPL